MDKTAIRAAARFKKIDDSLRKLDINTISEADFSAFKKACRMAFECLGGAAEFADWFAARAKVFAGAAYWRKISPVYVRTIKSLEAMPDAPAGAVAALENDLGAVYLDLARKKDALRSLASALKARAGLYGENSFQAAETLDNIGRVHSFYGEFNKALEYLEQALRIFERAAKYAREGGPKDPAGGNCPRHGAAGETGAAACPPVRERAEAKLASCIVSIGNIEYFKGNYDRALEYYEKASAVLDGRDAFAGIAPGATSGSCGGPGDDNGSGKAAVRDAPLAARIANDMGVVYLKLGRFDLALDNIGRGFELRSRYFGPGHPAVASSYNNLGNLYLDMEQYEKALENFGRSLAIRRAFYGASHPAVMTTVNDMGDVYMELGDYEKALENYSRALKARLRSLGARHPAVATCFNNLGLVYANLGEYEKALAFHRRSLKIKLYAYGPQHPYVAITYHNMGSVYSDMGEYEKALECFERSLDIDRGIFGGERPRIVETHNHIAEIYAATGRYDEAAETYKKVAGIIENNDGLKNIYLVSTLSAMGRLYLECSDLESAGGYFRGALETSAALHGEDHADTARCYFDMGLLRLKMRDHSTAVTFFSRAAEIDRTLARKGLKTAETEKFSADFLVGMLNFSSGDLIGALSAFERCKTELAAPGGQAIKEELEGFPQVVDEFIRLIRRRYGS